MEFGRLSPVLEVKASGDSWEVSGHVSTWGNVDSQGDVVMHGAFDDTLKSGRKVKFLMGHDARMVLGTPLELKADDVGLFGRFKISRTQLGQDVHTLLKDGALDSFSIGYIPEDIEFDDSGVRLLKSIDLLECSVVAIPANDQALVTGVKAIDRLSLSQLITAFQAEFARQKADGAGAPDAALVEQLQAMRITVDDLLSRKAADVEEAKADEEAAEAAVLSAGALTKLALMRRRAKARGLLDCAQ